MRTNERRSAAIVLAAVTGVLAMGAPVVARAQGGADAAMTDEARKLYDEGRKAKEKGDHATCVAKLRAAWALVQHRQVAGLLGECELRTGADRDAAQHLAHYLDNAGDASPEQVAAVRALYDEARATIAVVVVRASVEGADRKVDGRPLPPEERRVFLAPGEHVFAASKPGSGAGEKKVFVSGGQEREIVVDLVAEAAPAPAPLAPYQPPVQPPVEEPEGPSLVPGLVIGGVGLVGVGLGIGLLVAASGAGSDAEALAAGIAANDPDAVCSPAATPGFEDACAAFDDSVSQQDTLNVVGAISLIGGGVLLAGGAGWTVWAATADGDDAHVAVTPSLGPGGGALRLHGAF